MSCKGSATVTFSLLACVYRDGLYTLVQLVISHISAKHRAGITVESSQTFLNEAVLVAEATKLR